MDPKSQRVKLNDGHFIPVLGFGTYAPPEVAKREALEFTPFAIEIGFRHIDCAHAYQNEEEVGQAIRSKIADGTVKREDIFCTSKLWLTSLRPELVRPALEKSLKNLQLDYVDLYIMHYPLALKPGEELFPKDENGKLIFDSVDFCRTWEALEKCKDAGLTKSIGVSNFNHKQMEKILNKPGLKYKPVCNQVECHPYLNQSKLLDFCKSHEIVLVAYAALGSQRVKEWVNPNHPVLLEDPVLSAIAQKHKKTAALVALRYQIQRGVVVLAKGNNKKWIKENMQVFDFELTPEDMKAIDGLNRNIKYYEFHLEEIFNLQVVYLFFSSIIIPLWLTSLRPQLVQPALEKSPKNLQLDYIDLYIIHFPVALKPVEELSPKDENGKLIFYPVDLSHTWEVLGKCKDAGLTKTIRVSNCNHKQLEKILNKLGLRYKPVCNQVFDFELTPEDMKETDGINRNMRYYEFLPVYKSLAGNTVQKIVLDIMKIIQVECHPYLNQRKLLDFCKSHDIVFAAYSALGSQRVKGWVNLNHPILLENPVLSAIAPKHKKTPALVALHYQIQHGIVVLAKGNKKWIKENIQVAKNEALEFTPFAIEVGFRHIDCAHFYQNEEQVGQAIQRKIAVGTVKREDIFCTSKPGKELLPKDENGKLIFDSVDLCHTWEALEKCKDAGLTKSIGVSNFNHKQLEKILNKLGLKYKPVCNQHKKTAALVALRYQIQRGVVVLAKGNNKKWIKENMQVFEFELTPEDVKAIDGLNRNIRYYEFHLFYSCPIAHSKWFFSTHLSPDPGEDAGLTKSIGVSNFNHKQLEKILNKPGLKYKPICNQVECHPYLSQRKLLDFCKSHDIVLVAYAALGSQRLKEWVNLGLPVLLEDPVLCPIAKKHKQTPALVALLYQTQRGVVVLAKSYNKKRIKENIQVLDFELTPEDMKATNGINRNIRYYEFLP
ncbi:hypothetical protein JEQ12_004305 [Ovis aries]|uniref:NADP-dependent oxidoreductase domain-containing protein n=1 Tax=Ovis aries TaxID=9940 RepID=A0A836CWF8_SHEEP|nr:hypothetical protein JEQ12_004305 [Ovis aries]